MFKLQNPKKGVIGGHPIVSSCQVIGLRSHNHHRVYSHTGIVMQITNIKTNVAFIDCRGVK